MLLGGWPRSNEFVLLEAKYVLDILRDPQELYKWADCRYSSRETNVFKVFREILPSRSQQASDQ